MRQLKEQSGFLGSVFPIIVDHGLRVESDYEAFKTKKIASSIGFDAKIIKVKENILLEIFRTGQELKEEIFYTILHKIIQLILF